MERELFLVLAVMVGLAGPLALLLRPRRTGQPPGGDPARTEAQAIAAAFGTMGAGIAVFDAQERLVLASEHYRTLFGVAESDIRPGQPLPQLLQAIAFKGAAADAIGRESQWVEDCLLAHRAPRQPSLQRRRGDRWLCLSVGATPQGSVVHLVSDVSALGGTRRQVAEEIRRLGRPGGSGPAPALSEAAQSMLRPLQSELRRQLERFGDAQRTLHTQSQDGAATKTAVDQAVARIAGLVERYGRLIDPAAPAAA